MSRSCRAFFNVWLVMRCQVLHGNMQLFFLFGLGATASQSSLTRCWGFWMSITVRRQSETLQPQTLTDIQPILRGYVERDLSQRSRRKREGRWAESRIKSLTGGDKIAARFMRQDYFEFYAAVQACHRRQP